MSTENMKNSWTPLLLGAILGFIIPINISPKLWYYTDSWRWDRKCYKDGLEAGYGFKPVKNPYPQNTKAHNAYNRGLKDAGILVEE